MQQGKPQSRGLVRPYPAAPAGVFVKGASGWDGPASEFPGHVTLQWTLVTPEDAKGYLATMHDNRSKSKVEKGVLAGNLQEGNWYGAISPVFFDDSPVPRAWDGQHRFEAVIEAGTAAWMLFVIGVTEEEAEYIDTGRSRTRGDWYKMQGIPDYNRRAVVSRLLTLYAKYGIEGIRSPSARVLTPQEQDAWVNAEGIGECIKGGNALASRIGCNASYAAYALFQTMQNGVVDPDGFWESVRSGIGLEEGDPALTLRDWYMRKGKGGRLAADPRLMELYMLGTAWNHHVDGKSWAKPSPKFEVVGTTGKKVFPAAQVPEFKSLASRHAPRRIGER